MHNSKFFKQIYTEVPQNDFFLYECHGGLNKIQIGKKDNGFNIIKKKNLNLFQVWWLKKTSLYAKNLAVPVTFHLGKKKELLKFRSLILTYLLTCMILLNH